MDHPLLLQWSTGAKLHSKPFIARLQASRRGWQLLSHCTAFMPLHIDPGYIFWKWGWDPIPRKMRLLNVHCSFLQWSWQSVLSTAKVMQAPNQKTSSPPLTPLWLSDLFSQTWPTLHRSAFQGPIGAFRIGLVYGELCFWLKGSWRLLPCTSPFAPSGKNSVEALSSPWGKMASLRGLGETTPLCKTAAFTELRSMITCCGVRQPAMLTAAGSSSHEITSW